VNDWNWQTSLVLLVVTTGLLGVVINFIVTGNDVPTGIITLLSLFGGAVLGVERLLRVADDKGRQAAERKAQAREAPGPSSSVRAATLPVPVDDEMAKASDGAE